MSNLQDRRYLVTGASKGIGFEIARELVGQGARVAITARHEDKVKAAAEAIGAVPIVADVASEPDVVRSVAEAAEALGGIDGLVNNAGRGGMRPVEALDADEFRGIFEVNVLGAALMAREVVPHLKRAGGGDIVNVSSTAGVKGYPNGTAYAASKFALRGMTQCWQTELRPHDIRVFLVNPSLVQTEFGKPESPAPERLKPNLLQAPDIAHAVVSALQMARRGFIPELTVWATNPWDS